MGAGVSDDGLPGHKYTMKWDICRNPPQDSALSTNCSEQYSITLTQSEADEHIPNQIQFVHIR